MRSRRLLSLVPILLLGLSVPVGLRWGSLQPVASVSGVLAAPAVGDSSAVAWIEQDKDTSRLMVARGGAREVLSRPVLSGLTVGDGRLFTTVADATGGVTRLQSIPLRGGQPREVAAISAPADQLVAGDGWVCWLSGGKPALPAAPFLAAAGPATVIGAVPEKGGSPTAVVGSLGGGRAELIGITGGRLYWLERQPRSGDFVTIMMRRDLRGGPTEVLAQEGGAQSAVLVGDRLAWTAPSQEAALQGMHTSVKTAPLSAGRPTVVADWLGADAHLLASGGTLYAQDKECLWRLGDRRGTQRLVYSRSYGAQSPALAGGTEYLVMGFRRGKSELLARGVTWGAKLRRAVGLGA